MHWDYCHRTPRLSDLKCCKSSHSIPFTGANWSDGTAGLQMILSGPSSSPRKTCRATDSLNGKVTSKKKNEAIQKNTSNYRGWKHPRPPLTRCVDLKSCRIYQNPKLKNPGIPAIPGSGTQTKDVSHLNRHFTTLYNLTSDRRVKQRTKEPKSQSHPSELRGTLRQDWPFQKAHPQCQDLLPHQPKKLPQQHPRDRSRASRWNLK